MSIRFLKDQQLFVLMTQNTKYAFDLHCNRFLRHRYYGKRSAPIEEAKQYKTSFSPYIPGMNVYSSPDLLLQECGLINIAALTVSMSRMALKL